MPLSVNQRGYIGMIVVVLLLVGIGFGSYLVLQRTSFRGQAAATRISLGTVYEPRVGNSCDVQAADIKCMYPLADGFYCKQLCCGYVSYSSSGQTSCAPTPPTISGDPDGVLINAHTITKNSNQSTRSFMYRGIPENYLSTELYGLLFSAHAYDYTTVIYLTNPNPVQADVELTFKAIPYAESQEDDRVYSEKISLSPNQTRAISTENTYAIRDIGRRRYSFKATSLNNTKLAGTTVTTFPKSVDNNQTVMTDLNGIWADPLIPASLSSKALVQSQISCAYGDQRVGYYNSGHMILNTSKQPHDVTMTITDLKGQVIVVRNKRLEPNIPFDIYGPFLLKGERITPENQTPDRYDLCGGRTGGSSGFTGNLVVITNDQSESLVGRFWTVRDDQTPTQARRIDQDSASFGDPSETDASACTYSFPLFINSVLSSTPGRYNSGITLHSAKTGEGGTADLTATYYKADGTNQTTANLGSLTNSEGRLIYLPNTSLPDSYRAQSIPFWNKICGNSSDRIVSVPNTRLDNAMDYSGFADWSFSDRWIQKRWIVPYFVYTQGSSTYDSNINIVNPSDRPKDLFIKAYVYANGQTSDRFMTIGPNSMLSVPLGQLTGNDYRANGGAYGYLEIISK